jgi:tetratricopeptide (TPR) repeat protein
MKKLLYTLLLFLSIFCYGQENEYKKAVALYNAKNYTETIAVSEKILIGNPNPIIKVYASYMIADSYKSLEIYSQAYIKFKDYLDILNNSNSFSKKDLEKVKSNIETIIADLQTKISNDEKKEIKNNNQITLNSESSESKIKAVETTIITDAKVESKNTNTELKSTEDKSVEITKPIPNEKTVILTVSGTGKTLEEARLNALRSSIEQAFGAFISSKTEIFNDNLVKDEIVSVASGNVQRYDVVSQTELPNNGYVITLSATVSIDKLKSFAQSKGITVEFNGGLFATNLKLKLLNEDSEEKIMFELFGILHEKLQTSFDYLIETKNPILSDVKWGDGIARYNIPLKVEAIVNQNYDLTINHLLKVLNSLSLNKSELQEYTDTKKDTYKIVIKYNLTDYTFNLRTKLSFDLLKRLANSWEFYVGCFDVENGLQVFHGPSGKLEFNQDFTEYYNYFMPFAVPLRKESWNPRLYRNGKIDITSIFKIDVFKKNELVIDFSVSPGIFSWEDVYTLGELEKITNYTVKSSGIVSKFKHGGYVIYENNGEGIVAYPFVINKYNIWGGDIKLPIGTSSKLFSGKINTDKIASTSDKNIGKYFQKLNYAGYNDWAIPSADELSLVFKKVFMMGIGSEDVKGGKIYSSTELQNKYFNDFKNVITFNLTYHYEMYLKNFKWMNLKNEFNILYDFQFDEKLDISEIGGLDPISGSGNTFQPIRYFKY